MHHNKIGQQFNHIVEDETASLNLITYELFMSLVGAMGVILALLYYLPWVDEQTQEVLGIVIVIISFFLLYDFFLRLKHAPSKPRYFFTIGWLDFLSGLPFSPALRFLRLPRLVISYIIARRRVSADLRTIARQRLAESTLMITGLVVLVVMTLGSIYVVKFESADPAANIQTGDEAFWYTLVTIATVGYGDYTPITPKGRIVGSILIVVGVASFSVLTGYLVSTVRSRERPERDENEIMLNELTEIKQMLQALSDKVDAAKTGDPKE